MKNEIVKMYLFYVFNYICVIDHFAVTTNSIIFLNIYAFYGIAKTANYKDDDIITHLVFVLINEF